MNQLQRTLMIFQSNEGWKIELEGFGSGDQSSIWSNIFANINI